MDTCCLRCISQEFPARRETETIWSFTFGHWTVFRWLVNRGRERLSITRSAKHITTLVVHGVADAASRLQLVITLLWYAVLRRCWWSSQHRASVVLITLIIVLSLEPAISALCRRIYRAGQRDNQKLDHLSACDVIDADNKWERAIVVTDFPAKIVLCDGNFFYRSFLSIILHAVVITTTATTNYQWLKWRGQGAQPPAPVWAPCNSMSPLMESIKCYFMPK